MCRWIEIASRSVAAFVALLLLALVLPRAEAIGPIITPADHDNDHQPHVAPGPVVRVAVEARLADWRIGLTLVTTRVGENRSVGHRYYDPGIGRFTQSDPSGQEQNGWAFAANDPANHEDPMGLAYEWTGGKWVHVPGTDTTPSPDRDGFFDGEIWFNEPTTTGRQQWASGEALRRTNQWKSVNENEYKQKYAAWEARHAAAVGGQWAFDPSRVVAAAKVQGSEIAAQGIGLAETLLGALTGLSGVATASDADRFRQFVDANIGILSEEEKEGLRKVTSVMVTAATAGVGGGANVAREELGQAVSALAKFRAKATSDAERKVVEDLQKHLDDMMKAPARSTAKIPEDAMVAMGYVPAPRIPPAFPSLRRATPKTPVRGGGGLRKRWVDDDGNIYEWDSQHGALEKYNKRGKHLGEFDPTTGSQTKPPNPAYEVDP